MLQVGERGPRAALLTVVVGQFAVQLATVPISAILPTLADHYAADFALIAWVPGAYLLTLSGCILIAGRLGDLYGYRRVYATGLALYALAGGAGGWAPSAPLLIGLRAVQGLGGALLLGNGLAILANAFPGGQRGRAVGIAQVAATLGGVVGVAYDLLGLEPLGWQWLFWVLWPLGALGLWCARGLPDQRPAAPAHPDVLGAALLFLTLTVGPLSLNHLHGGEASFQADATYHLTMQALTLLLLAAFVLVERRQPRPLLRFADLRVRDFNALAVSNLLMHMTMMASIFTTPFLIERAFGLPKSFTSALLLALQLTWVLLAYVSGWLYDRFRARWLVPLGMALIAIGLLGMGLLADHGYAALVASGLVLGVGTGLYMTANNTLAVSLLPASQRGLASGILETTRQLGHTFGVAIPLALMGPAVSAAASGAAGSGFLQGFQTVSLAMAALCTVGVGLSLLPLLGGGPPAPRRAPTPAALAGGER